ncbi:hypothetical protein OIU74_005247, partial [Salix koriyanagi]
MKLQYLGYTPRKFMLQPKRKLLFIIESDQGAYTVEEREAAKKEFFEATSFSSYQCAECMVAISGDALRIFQLKIWEKHSMKLHLTQAHPPLCGRDHMTHRSAHFPVK